MDYWVGGPSFSAIPDVGVDKALAGLEGTLQRIRLEYPNPKHQFEPLSAFNLLTDEINEVSEEKGINMVVMGTKGATGSREIFMGTNAIYVIRKSKVPVLIVPEESSYEPLKNILFTSDYWSAYKPEELNALKDLARMFKAVIHVLHVKEEYELTRQQEDNKEHLQVCLQGIPHQFEELKAALMPDAIMEYISKGEFDMLAMMNRKHSLLEQLLWPQNVERIGFQVGIPFLVLPDSSEISR